MRVLTDRTYHIDVSKQEDGTYIASVYDDYSGHINNTNKHDTKGAAYRDAFDRLVQHLEMKGEL